MKIDVNTGVILGEYVTAPNGMGRDPSRTTVDQLGNVWVGNRAEGGVSGGQAKGSVARVGLLLGGTRVDANGTPNPSGDFVKPPWQYNTCVDRNGDNLIKTSRGLGDIRPWTNAGGVDTHGGVATAEDECLLNYTRVTGSNTRTVAVDVNNDVWVGGLGDLDHEKISGQTGQPIPGTQFNAGCGGYGGLIDSDAVLWSARGGDALLRFDTTTMSGTCLDLSHGDYGLGIDPTTGEIWHTMFFGGVVVKLAPNGTVLGTFPHGHPETAQGVAVDDQGNVWVAHSRVGNTTPTTVGHLRTDGTFVGNVPLPGGFGPTGVAVDSNGKVWVANISSNNAMRIDPSLGPMGGGGFPIGAVDMVVDLGPNAGPYNYSDMTGFVAIGNPPQGRWFVVQDAGTAGITWDRITWNTEPGEVSTPSPTTVDANVATLSNPVVNARALSARVEVIVGRSKSQAEVAEATINTSPSIRVRGVRARSETTCDLSVGETEIQTLEIGGIPVATTNIGPNTTITVAGTTVILNEQVPVAPKGLLVNAIRVVLPLGIGQVIISSARTDIHSCP